MMDAAIITGVTDIFKKMRLRPTQIRTVADRRFGDAQALQRTGDNARANGAIYLAGFVVECLLKARLMEKYPKLQSAGTPNAMPREQRPLWSLCYRSHDLDEILAQLPELVRELELYNDPRLIRMLKEICQRWTIFARYSPAMTDTQEASAFIANIRELKVWLERKHPNS